MVSLFKETAYIPSQNVADRVIQKGDVIIIETSMTAKKLTGEFVKNLRVQLEH